MATITLGGSPIHTSGELPDTGTVDPEFSLVESDLASIDSASLAGQRVVLNIFPSVDTAVCATSVRTFNKAAAGLENTTVVCVSADLPFAAARFCGAEGLDNVKTGSTFRTPSFGENYGVTIVDGAFAGLMARAVVVLDETGKVLHRQLVAEIADEPDYDAAIASLG